MRTPLAVALSIVYLGCLAGARAGEQGQADVRAPIGAGQFYPGAPDRLKAALLAMLDDALPPKPEKPVVIVVPHAAYLYSGQIAADAWKQAAAHRYETIVILGTNHTSATLRGMAIHPGTAFRTPLGHVPIDQSLGDALLKEDSDCRLDAAPHVQEHSIEVQVPFVQQLFPAAKIVPIVVGAQDVGTCVKFGRALAKVVAGRNVLIVASSDLSHYPAMDDAEKVDRETLHAMAKLDPSALAATAAQHEQRGIGNLVTSACGIAPVMAALAAASALNAQQARVVSYANSGELSVGEPGRVVGYGSMVIAAGARASDAAALDRPPSPAAWPPLRPEDKRAMLAFARETLRRYLMTETVPIARRFDPRLDRVQGVFVTLKKRGELRGCIGQIVGTMPLGRGVGAMAMAAAFGDPRFEALKADELKQIEIEISVLTPMKAIAGPQEIVVGRDGVLLRDGSYSGVFLPQVATEQGWNRDQLLDNLCEKAGRPMSCWHGKVSLSTFQADVFGESQFKTVSSFQLPVPSWPLATGH